MPLPDANNYSMRIYELLKETDLENLSYAQFQGVAEKLFIEPENEDEMRRLVLVQLARMAVRGDWNGFLSGSTGGIGGSIAEDQVAFGSATANEIEGNNNFKFTGSSVLELVNTLDIGGVGAAGIIKNSQNNQDLELRATGTGNVRVKNETTNQASQLNVQGNGSGDPIISLSNDTKSVSIQCDTNQKLSVKGGTDEFILDVSSASGGITFPDGTTQTTAASGGGGAYAVLFNGDITFSISATTSLQPLYGCATGYGTTNVSTSAFRSFFFYRPFYAWKTAQLTNIHYYVRTAQTGADMDLAIYESDSDGRPSNKIGSVTGATLATANAQTVSVTEESTGSMSLTKGNLYWIGVKDNSTGTTPQLRGFNNSQVEPLGFSNLGSAGQFVGYTTLLGTATAGSTFSFFGVSQNNGLSFGGEYA